MHRISVYFLTLIIFSSLGCAHSTAKLTAPDSDVAEATALIVYAAKGNADQVKKLLDKGENVDQANPQGVTSLMVASRRGHLDVIRALIAAKANLQLADDQGSTAMHYAVLGNQTKTVSLLIESHAPTNIKDSFELTPLMLATRFADLPMIKILLRAGAKVDEIDDNGWSPIFFSVPRGDVDIFEILADRLEHLNAQDADGDSLVMIATQYRNLPILKQLIAQHAPPDLTDKKNLRPIEVAIQNGDLETMRILAPAVPLEKVGADGRTPLMMAIDLRQKEIAAFLYRLKSDTKTKDQDGKTVLDHLKDAGLDMDWLGA